MPTTELVTVWLHWGAGVLMVITFLSFIGFFWAPGLKLGSELSRAEKALTALKKQGQVIDLAQVEKRAMVSRGLRHCWIEFRDTLHGQKTLTAAGSMEVSRWRATATAGGFFTESALVDTRLRTEFFRHLPGILTGLGIIGTFSGLILGLQDFRVTDDANTVRNSLQGLLHAVGSAFVVSAAAITLAMVVTFIEKVIVSKRYADVERLCGLLDGLFDSGAGEEYLARVVEATETSATQAMHLKEALVTDLKSILTDLTERQMATMTAGNAQLAERITTTLTESLRVPLEEISGAVRNVSSQQGEAVNRLLTDVLASFATRMEGMFGGQMSGMNDLLKQTAETMSGTAARFDALAGQIEQAGSGAADKMAIRMEALMESMASRQAESDAQTSDFFAQLRGTVLKSQTETADLMNGTFAELGETTRVLIGKLEARAEQANAEMAQRTQAFAEQTGAAIGQQGEQISALAASVDQATQAMRASVERMRSGVDETVNRMAAGAERLHGAAAKLENSLTAMTHAADSVEDGIETLTSASKGLTTGAQAMQLALSEHREVRNAVTTMVADLRAIVEAARRDATLTSQLVTTLDGAAGKLAQVQRQADDYLKGVSDTLTTAHEAFASSVASTLNQGNAAFHKELGTAVAMLRSAIQDLGDTLDSVPSARA
jgi:hypothetical protein